MNDKIAKYIIAGVKAKEKKKNEKELAKLRAEHDKKREWWLDECKKTDALEAENAKLKAELEEEKKVVAGYKESMRQTLGISKDEEDAANYAE